MLSKSTVQTKQIAAELAAKLNGGSVVLLNGDLGVGKTTFSKGIAKALGIKKTITSPTFNICNSYKGTHLFLHHIDAYRLQDKPTTELGLDELIGATNSITVVEWSQYIPQLLVNKNSITVDIAQVKNNTREITIK